MTQFQGTYARMAFPCFDEPEYKATFELSVVIDEGDTAISNGRIASDTPGPAPGSHTIRFERSPKLSTYLVALAIGDFQCLEGGSDGIPIRVCAVPEKRDLGRFALQASERFLRWYNQWYGVPYPFGKLDMVAIPDYEWGGMENTASIFYSDSALLRDPASLDATLVNAAFAVAAEFGGASLYDDWLSRLEGAKTPEEHNRYLFSLASFTDPGLVQRSLELWFSPLVREQNLPSFVGAMISNRASRDAAWAALKQNWPQPREKVVSFGGRGAVPALAAYCDDRSGAQQPHRQRDQVLASGQHD